MMIIFAIIVMGLSGICAETLILRELLVVFYGNELSIGIVLANWLLLESIGSIFIGRRIEYALDRIGRFINLQIFFAIFLPLAILFTRILKCYIFPTPGESLGLLSISWYSLLILAPVSISHGALFTFSCRIFADLRLLSRKDRSIMAQQIGSVYIYETLGTILGGVAITYLLIPLMSSLQIVFGVSLLNILVCILLRRRSVVPYLLALIFLFVISMPRLMERIDKMSIQKQWQGQNVLLSENSIYGNIVVTEREKQYTFFSDGVPVITTPIPDIASMEEFIHLPLLINPHPEDVLIIGGGAGGYLFEILKHQSIKWVDYCELDPLLIKILGRYRTPLTEAELSSKKVHVNYIDGRLFVDRTSRKYDAIFVGIDSPSDLQVNRLFTEEFFVSASSKLKDKGLIVLTLPGSLSYIPDQLRKLNLSILRTMKSIFPYVRVIPGESNLIIASSFSYSDIEDNIIRNLSQRNLDLNFLTIPYIKYKLDPYWLNWFNESIEKVDAKENSDLLPSAVFYYLSYWNVIFSPYVSCFFDVFEDLNTRMVILLLFIIFVAILISLHIGKRFNRKIAFNILAFTIVASGFAGMIFDLIIIFTFQSLYGYVYQMIGLLTSLFIAGTGVGGFAMNRILLRAKLRTFLLLEFGLISLALIFSLLLYLHSKLPISILFIFSFVCGSIVGAQFPLANKLYLLRSGDISRTSGLLYGSDLLGGWIAGMIGGTALIPVLGMTNTCLIVACVKISNLLLILILYRALKNTE